MAAVYSTDGGTFAVVSTSPTLTPAYPAGATAGSLFVLMTGHRNNAAAAAATPVFPSTFQSLLSSSQSNQRFWFHFKHSLGTETTSDTVTISASATAATSWRSIIYKFTGNDTSTSFFESTGYHGVTSTNVITDEAITSVGASRLAVNFIALNSTTQIPRVFTGMTGSTWVLGFGSSGLPVFSMQYADLPSSGLTIDGGSATDDAIGVNMVMGFAILPVVTAATSTAAGTSNIFNASVFSSPLIHSIIIN